MKGEFFRDTKQGKIAGVCAGLANYFGWEKWLVRILTVSAVLLGIQFVVVIYIAAWFILDKKPEKEPESFGHHRNVNAQNSTRDSILVKSRIWQAGEPPKQAFHDICHKYHELEHQLRSMERHVTSADFTVSREINKL